MPYKEYTNKDGLSGCFLLERQNEITSMTVKSHWLIIYREFPNKEKNDFPIDFLLIGDSLYLVGTPVFTELRNLNFKFNVLGLVTILIF